MTLDDIPADVILTLTGEMNRLFNAAGCTPLCHACSSDILIGKKFKLLSFLGTDEMLCGRCTREDLEEEKREMERLAALPRRGGFSRPSARGN